MRASFPSPPPRDELARRPLHVLLRDFPELLALFRAEGPDPVEAGGRTIEALVSEPGPLVDRIEEALAWRSPAPGR